DQKVLSARKPLGLVQHVLGERKMGVAQSPGYVAHLGFNLLPGATGARDGRPGADANDPQEEHQQGKEQLVPNAPAHAGCDSNRDRTRISFSVATMARRRKRAKAMRAAGLILVDPGGVKRPGSTGKSHTAGIKPAARFVVPNFPIQRLLPVFIFCVGRENMLRFLCPQNRLALSPAEKRKACWSS